MRRRNRPPEYPPTPMHKLTTFRTRFGDEGMTLIPAVKLTDRDRRAVDLESSGYTHLQTFVYPDHTKSVGNIGNIHILPEEPEQLAADGILIAWAAQRMVVAVEEYGAKNVAICKDMRFPPLEKNIYESYEYMALYVRSEVRGKPVPPPQ